MDIFLIVPACLAIVTATISVIVLSFIIRNKAVVIGAGFVVFALVFAGLVLFVPPPDL